jgi:GntR family histidine utilization transcriptional repressor
MENWAGKLTTAGLVMGHDTGGQHEQHGPEPIYVQVKRRIIAGIRSGEWTVGDRLPSEMRLVKELGVSKMTVNRAFRELAAEGMIRRVPALGSFVAEPRSQGMLFELRDVVEDIRAHGGAYSCRVVALERTSVPRRLINDDLRGHSTVLHSLIVHKRNGVPVQIEERWVNPEVLPNYLEVDLQQVSSFQYLAALPPTEMEHVIRAIMPNQEEAALLELRAPEPCLLLTRRTWTGRQFIALSNLTSPGSRYTIENRFKVAGPVAMRHT